MSKIIDNGDSQIITVEAGHYVKIAWLGGTYTLTAVAGGLPNLPAVQGTANSAADQTFGPYTSAVTMKLQVSAIGAAAWDSGATPVFEPPGDTFVRQSDGVPVTLTGTGTGAAFTSSVDGAGNVAENDGLEWKYLAGDLPSWIKGPEWAGGYPVSTGEITNSHGMHMRLDGSKLTTDNGLISRTGISPAIDLSSGRLMGILIYAHRLNQGNPGTGIRLRVGTSSTNYNYYNWATQENTLVEGWNWLVIHSLDSGQIRKIQTGVTMAGWQVGAGTYNASTTPATYLAIECTNMRSPNYPILWCSSIFSDGGERCPMITVGFDVTEGYQEAETVLDSHGFSGYLAVGRAKYAVATDHVRLYNKGWDIIGHTGRHQNIGQYVEREEIRSELQTSRTQGQALGFLRSCDLFASPNGSWSNRSVDVLARLGFKWHRGVNNAPVTQYDKSVGHLNPLVQGSFTCGPNTLENLIQRATTLLLTYKSNCHFYTHEVVPGGDGTNWPADSNNIYAYTLSGFMQWLRETQNAGLCQVVTPSEYVEASGGAGFDPKSAWRTLNNIDIVLGASPAVVSNPTMLPVMFCIAGGTVSAVELSYDAGGTYIDTGAVGGVFTCEPGVSLRITYTAAPTVKQLRAP